MDRKMLDLGDETQCAAVSKTAKSDHTAAGASFCCALLASVKAELYKTGLELAEINIESSKRLIAMGSAVAEFAESWKKRSAPDWSKAGAQALAGNLTGIGLEECTGIKAADFSRCLEDCFPIDVAHLWLPRGKELIALHRLRCALRVAAHEIQREKAPVAKIRVASGSVGEPDYNAVSACIWQIINSLSRMVCEASGSEICQKR
jgi:hypothetical protein